MARKTEHFDYHVGLGAGVYANSSLGTSGQVLKSDGTNVYWGNDSSSGGDAATLDGYDSTAFALLAAENVFTLKQTVNLNTSAAASPGTTGVTLHLSGSDGISTRLWLDSYGVGTNYTARRANGTNATKTALLAADLIMNNSAFGHDGTAYSASSRGAFQIAASQNWAVGAHGTRLNFVTTADNSTSSTTRWVMDQDGSLIYSGGTATGVSTVNAVDYFDNGVNINTIYASLAATNTFTGNLIVNKSGVAVPTAFGSDEIRIVGATGNDALFWADSFGGPPVFGGRRAEGVPGTPTAVQSGNTLVALRGYGYGTSAYSASHRGSVSVLASENWTNTAQGTRIVLATTPNLGATQSARWLVENDGSLIYSGGTATGVSTVNAVDYFDNGVNINTIYLASASYTAADVLSKLLTVDGSGSGLDADLWDGNNFATYLNQAVLTTSAPTFAGATLTAGLAVTSTAPSMVLVENDQGTDLKRWDFLATSGTLLFRMVNDANSLATNLATITRTSTYTTATWNFSSAVTLQYNSNTIWHAGNDGAGSGLDADLLDGKNTGTSGNVVPLLDGNNTYSGTSTFTNSVNASHTTNGAPNIRWGTLDALSSDASANAVLARNAYYDGTAAAYKIYGTSSGGWGMVNIGGNTIQYSGASGSVTAGTTITPTWYTIWHAGNDGSGSGLDADLLDGYNVGTSGGAIPLMNGTNTWSGIQTFSAGFYVANFSTALGTGGSGAYWGQSLYYNTEWRSTVTGGAGFALRNPGSGGGIQFVLATAGGTQDTLVATVTATLNAGGTIWTSSNDGASSGLDADLLDGYNIGTSGAAIPLLNGSNTWGSTAVFSAGVTFSSTAVFNNVPTINAANPIFQFYESDAAVDTKYWEHNVNSGVFNFRLVNDAYAAANSIFTVTRTAHTAATFNFGSIVTLQANGNTIWHAGNDGVGSGLDADLLDGNSSAYFLAASTYTAADVLSKLLTVDGAGSGLDADLWDGNNFATYLDQAVLTTSAPRFSSVYIGSDTDLRIYESSTNVMTLRAGGVGTETYLTIGASSFLQLSGATIWHSSNDGAASGLDADLLDGKNTGTSGNVVPLLDGNNTYSGTSAFTGAVTISRGAVPLQITTTVDNANVEGFILEGDRATPAANDIVYMNWRLSNSAGTQTEFGRQSIVASTVTAASEASYWMWAVRAAGTLTNVMRLSSSALTPQTTDGLALGSTSLMWSDLFLASGAVVNFNNGDVLLTHSANTLAFTGASSGYTFDAAVSATGLNLNSATSFLPQAIITNTNDDANAGYVIFYKTPADTTVTANDYLGTVLWYGHGSASASGTAATVYARAEGTRGTNWVAANLVLGSIQTSGSYRYLSLNADGTITWNSGAVWHAGNDGAGSGLDADLLDGNNIGTSGTAIPLLSGTNTWGAAQTFVSGTSFGSGAGAVQVTVNGAAATWRYISAKTNGVNRWDLVLANSAAESGSNAGSNFQLTSYDDAGASLRTDLTITRSTGAWAISSTSITAGGNTVWNAGNDGAGSGLDADLLDGKNTGTSGNVVPLLDGTNTWSGNQTISTTGTGAPLTLTSTDAGASAFTFDLYRNSASPAASDGIAAIRFRGQNSTPATVTYSAIQSSISDPTAASEDATLSLQTMMGGALTNALTLGYSSTQHRFTNPTDLIVSSVGANGYGAFYAIGSGTNSAYVFLGNATSGERGRIWATNAGALSLSTNAGVTAHLSISSAGVITASGSTVWNAGNDGAGSGLDADLLDGISSTGFMILANQAQRLSTTAGIDVSGGTAPSASTNSALEVFQATAGADAYITFHVGSDYAVHFGLDGGTNDLFVGGWSMGASTANKIWHAGNDGAGSGLDADLWDGNNFATYLNQALLTSSSPTFANITSTGTNGLQVEGVAPILSMYETDAAVDKKRWRFVANNDILSLTGVNDAYSAETGIFSISRTSYTAFTFVFSSATTITRNGSTLWDAGNDGAGSGLDADLLDGYTIGTSGSNIPILSGINTWSSLQTMSSLTARVTLTTAVSGTLTSAHANISVELNGNVTLNNSVFTAGDKTVFDPGTAARTFTRGAGVTMYVNGTDSATATLAANQIGGMHWRTASVVILTGSFS